MPFNRRITFQFLEIYFFNFFVSNDLEFLIQGFKTQIIDQSRDLLTQIVYEDSSQPEFEKSEDFETCFLENCIFIFFYVWNFISIFWVLFQFLKFYFNF